MKLRCPSSNELGFQPCTRCTRAKADCVVSYNRPLGRRARLNIPPSVAGQTAQPECHSASPTVSRLADNIPNSFSQSQQDVSSHISSARSAATSPNHTRPTSRQQQGMEPLDFSDELSTFLCDQADTLLSYGVMTPPIGPDTIFRSAAVAQPGHSWNRDFSDSNSSMDISQPLEVQCDSQIAGLNLELSQQLDAWNQSVVASPRKADQPSSSIDIDSSNTFSDALQAMSNLVAIGQSYTTRPSIVIILQLLTAYLQVVSLCNHIFRRLREQLQDTTASKGQGMQSLPGLQLAGVVVQQGDLQTKILVQATLHYFQVYEKVLSLPPDLCLYVPQAQTSSEGLLDQESEQDQMLINALLQILKSGNEGPSSLVSLRKNVAQVRWHLSI